MDDIKQTLLPYAILEPTENENVLNIVYTEYGKKLLKLKNNQQKGE